MSLVAAALALAGCTTQAATIDVPTSAKAPTYTCSPTAAGASPTPCTPEEYSEQQREAQAAEEAKGVYREMVSELSALQRAGGATTASSALQQRAGGPYLEGQLTTLRGIKKLGATQDGTVRITKLSPVAGASERGYDTALLACVDATASSLVKDDKTLVPGRLIAETVYFRYDSGQLKAWDSEKANAKKSC